MSVSMKPGATALDGFQATVTVIKANEAILSRQRVEFKDEWYQLMMMAHERDITLNNMVEIILEELVERHRNGDLIR